MIVIFNAIAANCDRLHSMNVGKTWQHSSDSCAACYEQPIKIKLSDNSFYISRLPSSEKDDRGGGAGAWAALTSCTWSAACWGTSTESDSNIDRGKLISGEADRAAVKMCNNGFILNQWKHKKIWNFPWWGDNFEGVIAPEIPVTEMQWLMVL